MGPVLSQMNDIHILVSYIFYIQFNITLKLHSLRFEIFTALLIITVWWNMTPYWFIVSYGSFGGARSLHHRGPKPFLGYPKDVRSKLFQNVCNKLPVLNNI
jgi:hypothetical protein